MALITVLSRTDYGYKGKGDAPLTLPRMHYREAFETKWPDDRHFVSLWIEGEDVPDGTSIRPRKESLPALLAGGYKVLHGLVVLETDVKTVEPPDDPRWGHYETRSGYRFFAELTTPITPLWYEAQVRQAIADFQGWGHTIDLKCKDWTRIWHLPRIPRYEHLQSPIVYPTAALLPVQEPPPLPPRPKRDAPPRGGERWGRTLAERMDAAREWLKTCPVAVSGQHGDLTTWNAAQIVVRGFGLDVDSAVEVLEEWNARCEPPWDVDRLVYKAEQAEEHGTVLWGAKFFTLGRPRAGENEHRVGITPTSTHPKKPQPVLPPTPESTSTHPQTDFDPSPVSSDTPQEPTQTVHLTDSQPPLEGGSKSEEGGSKSEKKSKKKPKKSDLDPPPDDPPKLKKVTDLLLAEVMLQDFRDTMGQISALNGTLYYLDTETNSWAAMTDVDFTEWCQRWDGVSPDPTEFSPIIFSFNRMTLLKRHLAGVLDASKEIDNDALFYAEDGAVFIDRVEPATPPITISRLPGRWQDQHSAPRFEAFIKRILPNPTVREFVRDFVGLCLLGRGYETQTAVSFEGAGANGKSMLLSLIGKLFSGVHKASVPPAMMELPEKLDPFRLARINIVPDLSTSMLSTTAGFNKVVAGDVTMSRKLYHDPETIEPFAGNLFSCNLPPETKDESMAFIRRWLVVYFGTVIPEHERVYAIDDLLWNGGTFKGETWEPEAMGIAKWFFEGARKVHEHGLTIPDAVRQEMREWADEADPVRRIVSKLVQDQSTFTAVAMHAAVNNLLIKESLPRVSTKQLARYYRVHGFNSRHTIQGTIWDRRTN